MGDKSSGTSRTTVEHILEQVRRVIFEKKDSLNADRNLRSVQITIRFNAATGEPRSTIIHTETEL